MCGISVVISREAELELADLIRMTDAIRHRGPDDEGYAILSSTDIVLYPLDGRASPLSSRSMVDQRANETSPQTKIGHNLVAMGHRRLSILDLSPAGHQPMCTQDRRHWIVYNGEIYNYRELRAELEAVGREFTSEADTEVILHAYAVWGRECLHRFNGMFAFVLFDRETRKIFAARDRFGVKPLYYWFSPEGFLAFASEIKQFTVLPGWEARLNCQRAFDFLAYALIDHTNETLFDGVFQLRGGEAVEVGLEEIDLLPIYRYYTLTPIRSDLRFDEACEYFRNLFINAVRLRMRADVPIGSCLSGGLDSSSIVCVVNELLSDERRENIQKTFSSCSEIAKYDERQFIDEVIKDRAIEAHYDYPSLELLFSDIDRLIWHQDEPFASMSMYAQWNVFQLAASCGVKVMLDGQGADEQLCGYHSFFPVRYADLIRRGAWGRCLREIRKAETIYGYSTRLSLTETAFFLLPDRLRRPIQRRRYPDMLRPPWLDLTVLGDPETIETAVPQTHTVEDLSTVQLLHTSLPGLLHWEDRNSMAHSIESRVPFLDYRLVEFVTGLSTEYKLASCTTKRVLREGMRDYLPQTVRTRQDKLGFITAEEEWVTKTEPNRFRNLVVESVNGSQGVLTPAAITYFDEIIDGKRPYADVWRWISFVRWIRIFNVKVGDEATV